MKQPLVSVAIATHNPRVDHLTRCLQGLQQQTMDLVDWELIVVDNQSTPPLANSLDLSWHPDSRIIVEPTLGLAFARRRGFLESRADLIVNVDDDNVLSPNYLTNSVNLATAYPFIGVFGAQNGAEFEHPPTHAPNYYYGAERTVGESVWSNLRDNIETTPWGAGSVVRRVVAIQYLKRLDRDPRLLELGRRGNQLFSCEDIDIANSACDLGLGKGIFTDLGFTHLIPAKRMTDEFKITNSYWNIYSAVIHNFLQYDGKLPPRRSWQNRLQITLRGLFRDRVSRKIMHGELRAERDATREIRRRGWI